MSLQFFGCYFNLFRLMTKCGVLQNLLRKEHVHTFVNTGGDVRELDFRFFVGDKKIGAPFHGLKAFFTTPQLSVLDKVRFLTSCLASSACTICAGACSFCIHGFVYHSGFWDPLLSFFQGCLRVASWMSS